MLYSFRLNLLYNRTIETALLSRDCAMHISYTIFRFLLDSWACIQRTAREMGSTLFNRLCNGQSCICRHVRGREGLWPDCTHCVVLATSPLFDPCLFERWRLLLYASITLPISVLLSSLFRLFVWLVFAFSLVLLLFILLPSMGLKLVVITRVIVGPPIHVTVNGLIQLVHYLGRHIIYSVQIPIRMISQFIFTHPCTTATNFMLIFFSLKLGRLFRFQ